MESTVRSAFVKAYYAALTSDCTTTYSAEAHERTLRLVHRFYGEVAATAEIVDCWTKGAGMITCNGMSYRVAALAALFVVAGTAPAALAQAFPAKPMRLLIDSPPGTGPQTIIRQINQKLGDTAAWTLVVENRPGQGGSVAATQGARATPDGYTLLFSATGAVATNPVL